MNNTTNPQSNTSQIVTIGDLAKQIPVRTPGKRIRAGQTTTPISDGLTAVPFQNKVGYRVIQPEEMLSLRVPIVHQSRSAFLGYQRDALKTVSHVWEIAWSGKEVPCVQVTLDEEGNAYITDGQHRVLAAIANRTPLDAVVKQRTFEQAHDLFVNQRFAKRIQQDHLVLTGTDAMSKYVQQAIVDPQHPWHDMISDRGNRDKLTPKVAHRVITMYGCDIVGSLSPEAEAKADKKFDKKRADELADLLGVFGRAPDGTFSKRNNPNAFKQTNLSALAQAAIHILIRADHIKPGPDKERWMRHMPMFNWIRYTHVRDMRSMTEELLHHWNKKLSSERKVERRVYRQGGPLSSRKAATV